LWQFAQKQNGECWQFAQWFCEDWNIAAITARYAKGLFPICHSRWKKGWATISIGLNNCSMGSSQPLSHDTVTLGHHTATLIYPAAACSFYTRSFPSWPSCLDPYRRDADPEPDPAFEVTADQDSVLKLMRIRIWGFRLYVINQNKIFKDKLYINF
jgi:hypothetical protein